MTVNRQCYHFVFAGLCVCHLACISLLSQGQEEQDASTVTVNSQP